MIDELVKETQTIRTESDKEWLRNCLQDAAMAGVQVTFTKKDGTEREMNCTLVESRIPTDKQPKTDATPWSDEAIRVFDTDIGEWRSFRFDSVKKILLKNS